MRIISGSIRSPVHLGRAHPAFIPARSLAPISASVTMKGHAFLGQGAVWLVLAAVGYNALLAFSNARGLTVGLPVVIVTEIAVLAAAGLVLLRSGIRTTDTPALLLFGFFLLNAIIVSLASGALFVDMARNAAIIAIFLMIGMRVDETTVRRIFAIVSGLVFVVLLLECVSVATYALLLEPGRYFEQTRGISRFEFDEIGLFANAIGFDDRFSILNIVGHRTSSLFLEQVSLANFATILTVFLVSLWGRLSRRARILYPLLIAFILVTNNSRTALAIALAAPLVYFIAPRLPRLIGLAVLPMTLLLALVVTWNSPPSREDDLVGRLGLTIRTLADLDLAALLGAHATSAADFADSGYTFVIYASSIFGLLLFWAFFSLISASTGATAAQKRASLAMGLYLFLNLMVSGTSVFSIKTAALLWFLIGFLRREAQETGELVKPDLRPIASAQRSTGGGSSPHAYAKWQPGASHGRLPAER